MEKFRCSLPFHTRNLRSLISNWFIWGSEFLSHFHDAGREFLVSLFRKLTWIYWKGERNHQVILSKKQKDNEGMNQPNVLSMVRAAMKSIARNQGHFEPANNYQRYIVLHSGTIGTIEYQENSIWRQSRLDLQRSVFRTMTYTIWAPQIFYLMKRKRKEDLQVNLWDFSRQSDDLMSEFWFAFNKLLNLHLTPRIFFSEKDLRTNLFPSKNISVARVWPFQS